MITLEEVEGTKHTTEALALVCQKIGYKSSFAQLSFNNGATASDLFEFFDDNPGAIEAVLNWILEHKGVFPIVGNDEDEQEKYIDMVVNDSKINAIRQYRLDKGVLLKDADEEINKLIKEYCLNEIIQYDQTTNDYSYVAE